MDFLKDECGTYEVGNSVLFLIAIIGILILAAYAMYLQNFEIPGNAVNGLLGFIGGVGVGAYAVSKISSGESA